MKAFIQNNGEIPGARERVEKILAGDKYFAKNENCTESQIEAMTKIAYEGFDDHRMYISLPQEIGDSVSISGYWQHSPCEILPDGSLITYY